MGLHFQETPKTKKRQAQRKRANLRKKQQLLISDCDKSISQQNQTFSTSRINSVIHRSEKKLSAAAVGGTPHGGSQKTKKRKEQRQRAKLREQLLCTNSSNSQLIKTSTCINDLHLNSSIGHTSRVTVDIPSCASKKTKRRKERRQRARLRKQLISTYDGNNRPILPTTTSSSHIHHNNSELSSAGSTGISFRGSEKTRKRKEQRHRARLRKQLLCNEQQQKMIQTSTPTTPYSESNNITATSGNQSIQNNIKTKTNKVTAKVENTDESSSTTKQEEHNKIFDEKKTTKTLATSATKAIDQLSHTIKKEMTVVSTSYARLSPTPDNATGTLFNSASIIDDSRPKITAVMDVKLEELISEENNVSKMWLKSSSSLLSPKTSKSAIPNEALPCRNIQTLTFKLNDLLRGEDAEEDKALLRKQKTTPRPNSSFSSCRTM